jgi:hypothetical protein
MGSCWCELGYVTIVQPDVDLNPTRSSGVVVTEHGSIDIGRYLAALLLDEIQCACANSQFCYSGVEMSVMLSAEPSRHVQFDCVKCSVTLDSCGSIDLVTGNLLCVPSKSVF